MLPLNIPCSGNMINLTPGVIMSIRLRKIMILFWALSWLCGGVTIAQSGKASRATMKADVASPEALARAVYETISGPVGQERDWTRMKNLWLPGARIILASQKYRGKAAYESLNLEQFILRVSDYYRTEGFYEKELAGRLNQFGEIASYWSTFEVRKGSPTGAFNGRGINSFQMVRKEGRWWITQLVFDFESDIQPIPDRYLRLY